MSKHGETAGRPREHDARGPFESRRRGARDERAHQVKLVGRDDRYTLRFVGEVLHPPRRVQLGERGEKLCVRFGEIVEHLLERRGAAKFREDGARERAQLREVSAVAGEKHARRELSEAGTKAPHLRQLVGRGGEENPSSGCSSCRGPLASRA